MKAIGQQSIHQTLNNRCRHLNNYVVSQPAHMTGGEELQVTRLTPVPLLLPCTADWYYFILSLHQYSFVHLSMHWLVACLSSDTYIPLKPLVPACLLLIFGLCCALTVRWCTSLLLKISNSIHPSTFASAAEWLKHLHIDNIEFWNKILPDTNQDRVTWVVFRCFDI